MTATPTYRPSTQRVPCGTALVLFDDARRILMIKRTGAHGAGTWSVPGGWLDRGETPEEGVVREAWEEVGITVDPQHVNFFGYTTTHYPEKDIHDLCLWFDATEWQGKPQNTNPDRIVAVQWISLEGIYGGVIGPLFPGLLEAIRKGLL